MLFRLFNRRERIETRTPRPRVNVRPRLEALEDRQLPSATYFQAVNLVSDQAGHAKIQDTSLVNAWGIAVGAGGGNFWISDNGSDLTTLYSGDVNGSPLQRNNLVVSIPGGAPTGQLFNTTSDVVVSDGSHQESVLDGRGSLVIRTARAAAEHTQHLGTPPLRGGLGTVQTCGTPEFPVRVGQESLATGGATIDRPDSPTRPNG